MVEKAQALSKLRVIELGQFISAPYCAKLWADSGAEVIKVEEPGKGDDARAYGPFPDDVPHPEKSGMFLYLNTNKLSVTLNLRTRGGQKLFKQLISRADVLVENHPQAQMEQWGLTYAEVTKINPKIIMTSVTPFGQTGPYRNYKAYHDTACAVGGGFTLGAPEREPLTYPLLQGHFAGGIHAAMATMVALIARRKAGAGQHIDIAEADIWAGFFNAIGTQAYVFANKLRKRQGHRTKGYFYPMCILPCKDGYISEIAVTGSQWKAFLELIGGGQVPDWYKNDPRFADRVKSGIEYADELDAKQAPWLMQHTKEEIFKLCQERRIPFAPVYTVDEVVNHPHLRSRNYFTKVAHPEAGMLTYPGAPFEFSETPMRINRAPLLGEHNYEIYCQRLGYTKGELVRMRQASVI